MYNAVHTYHSSDLNNIYNIILHVNHESLEFARVRSISGTHWQKWSRRRDEFNDVYTGVEDGKLSAGENLCVTK